MTMANYYLQIDGINGESVASGFEKQIEVGSWSFGASSPADVGGGGLSAGTPSLSDFTCTFDLDSASYQILKDLYQGTHVDKTTFTGVKTGGGGTPYNYMQVIMSNCFITGFNTGGGGDGVPSATMSLAYAQIEYDYYTQDTSSGQTTQAGSATYSVTQVKAS
jgi:type VI secretion system secreted protein Hcp